MSKDNYYFKDKLENPNKPNHIMHKKASVSDSKIPKHLAQTEPLDRIMMANKNAQQNKLAQNQNFDQKFSDKLKKSRNIVKEEEEKIEVIKKKKPNIQNEKNFGVKNIKEVDEEESESDENIFKNNKKTKLKNSNSLLNDKKMEMILKGYEEASNDLKEAYKEYKSMAKKKKVDEILNENEELKKQNSELTEIIKNLEKEIFKKDQNYKDICAKYYELEKNSKNYNKKKER